MKKNELKKLVLLISFLVVLVFEGTGQESEIEKENRLQKFFEKEHCTAVKPFFYSIEDRLIPRLDAFREKYAILIKLHGGIEKKNRICALIWHIVEGGKLLQYDNDSKIDININFRYQGEASSPTAYAARAYLSVSSKLKTNVTQDKIDYINDLMNNILQEKSFYADINDMKLYEAVDAGIKELEKVFEINGKNDVLLSKETFLKQTKEATTIATKYKGNETDPACNICVRSALYLLKKELALFPYVGSAYYDPDDNYTISYLKGFITNPGRAKNIKEDFDVLATKKELSARFVAITQNKDEKLEAYFLRLQDMADAGKIVIGVMLNSSGTSGHIVMITPGGLVKIYETDLKWGESFTRDGRDISKVPRVLECGSNARESEAPLCKNVDYNGSKSRLKWFEYKFK